MRLDSYSEPEPGVVVVEPRDAAARLVRRMRDNVTQEVGVVAESGKRITLRAAYSAAGPAQKVEPSVLLQRARNALGTS